MVSTANNPIYDTWMPIITDKYPNLSNGRMRTMCRYAHFHAHEESFMTTSNAVGCKIGETPDILGDDIFGDGNFSSLLPFCLDVLAKIKNLDLFALF